MSDLTRYRIEQAGDVSQHEANDQTVEWLKSIGVLVPVDPDYEAGYKLWQAHYLTAAGAGPHHPDTKEALQQHAFVEGVKAALRVNGAGDE